MQVKERFLFIFSFTLIFQFVRCYNVEKYSFLMPNVKPDIPELYLCTPVKIDTENAYYIVGFEPNATMNTAHHIILYGCSKPGSTEPVWNCGEMSPNKNFQMANANPCQQSSSIMYAWARDAPQLILPQGVGFKVGKGTRIKYLVLQVHYSDVEQFKDGRTDDSGISLHITRDSLNKLAGVYLLGTAGGIPPHSVEYMESSCEIKENKTIHPFAYRVHTHSLGKIVSGYVIRNNKWIKLGKRDPLQPQMFYDIEYNGTITYGDRLAARCTMKSDRDTWTYVGNTNKDEMCNFYIMYYVENEEPLNVEYCFSSGPPKYYWHKDGLINIPDKEASTL